jgi:hypothetical protein
MPEAGRGCYIVIVVLLEFARKLYMYTFGIGHTQEKIIAGPVPARSPQNRGLAATQIVGPLQQLLPISDAIAHVIDIHLSLHEHDRVMIAIATQPGAFTKQPIRDIETQGLSIKLNHHF